MFERNGLWGALAIGLIGLSVLGLGFFLGRIELVGERPSRDQAACAEGDYANCDTGPKALDPVSGEYRPADPNEKANRDEYRAERDLIAQRDMAFWAAGMFFATACGVVLLYFTLRETATAAKFAAETLKEAKNTTLAANATTAVTREIGSAQSQAYLVIQAAYLQLVIDRTKDKVTGVTKERVTLALSIKVKNTGQTPAHRIRYDISGMITFDEDRSHDIKRFQYVESDHSAVGAGQEVLDEYNLGDGEVGQDVMSAVVTEGPGITIKVSCRHGTVFEKRTYETPSQRFILGYRWDRVTANFFERHEMDRVSW